MPGRMGKVKAPEQERWLLRHAKAWHDENTFPFTRSQVAQPGIAADRVAREIVDILKARRGALAAAECQPVRHPWQRDCPSFL